MDALTLVSTILFTLFLMLINKDENPESEKKENEDIGSISGRITIKGKPAAGFELALFIYDAIPKKTIAKTMTAEDGRYRFTNLSANHYWVRVLAPEYITQGEYDDEGPGRRISIADGEAVDVADLDLIRGGVISGKVVDVDGVPVVNEWVELYQVNDNKPNQYWRNNDEDEPFWLNNGDCNTDAQGNYRLYGIPAGRYLVAVGVDFAKKRGRGVEGGDIESLRFTTASGNRCFEQHFYGDVKERLKAQVIDVFIEEEVQGIDIRMPDKGWPVYSVSGRIIEAETGKPLSGCNVLIESLNGGGYVTHDLTDENGQFEIGGKGGMLKGRYFVDAYLNDKIELVTERVDFEIKDRNVTGLEIKARRGLMMTGRVAIEDGNPWRAIEKLSQQGFKVSSDKIVSGREAVINSDGSFTVTGLYKGTLRFPFVDTDFSTFSLIRIEHPQARHKMVMTDYWQWYVEMGDEDLSDVCLVLKYRSGEIKGRVNLNGKLPLGVTLYVSISRKLENGGWGTRRDVDANGNFAVESLEPGEYSLSIHGGEYYSEHQTIRVEPNSVTEVTFDLDVSKIEKWQKP
jgi:5-hydroxyisourate hydrolase-like protein (transthyretin family)